MIEKRTPLTGTQNTEEEKPDLPDLTRLFKNRARDIDVIRRCKTLLIAGMAPGKVALVLRLPLERVMDLYDNSYNPKCRRFAKTNSFTNSRLALTSFMEDATLSDICHTLALPLFTVVQMLREQGITDAAMAPKMPRYDDPLCVEYRRVVARKAASRHKPIQIRRVAGVSQNAAASQSAAGTTATA